MKRPQTTFHTHTMRESQVNRSKKSQFIIRSKVFSSSVFGQFFINTLLKLQQQIFICFYKFSYNFVIIVGLLRLLA